MSPILILIFQSFVNLDPVEFTSSLWLTSCNLQRIKNVEISTWYPSHILRFIAIRLKWWKHFTPQTWIQTNRLTSTLTIHSVPPIYLLQTPVLERDDDVTLKVNHNYLFTTFSLNSLWFQVYNKNTKLTKTKKSSILDCDIFLITMFSLNIRK